MEDLDIRIFNLGSKLAIDPRADSNNPDCVSYLPSKNSSTVSPSASPRPHQPDKSGMSGTGSSAGTSSSSASASASNQAVQQKSLQPVKRSVSSSSNTSSSSSSSSSKLRLNRSVSPAVNMSKQDSVSTSKALFKSGSSKQISKSRSPNPSLTLSSTSSRNSNTNSNNGSNSNATTPTTTSFSKFLKSTAAATANASARSPLVSSSSQRSSYNNSNAEDSRDSRDSRDSYNHDKETSSATPKKSGSSSTSKIFLNSNNRHNNINNSNNTHSNTNNNTPSNSKTITASPSSNTQHSSSASSNKSSIFLLSSKQRAAAGGSNSNNSSPHLHPQSQHSNNSPQTKAQNSDRRGSISGNRKPLGISDGTSSSLKPRDRSLSRSKLSNSGKDIRERDTRDRDSRDSREHKQDFKSSKDPATPNASNSNNNHISNNNPPFILPPLLSPTLPDWCDEIPDRFSNFARSGADQSEKSKQKTILDSPRSAKSTGNIHSNSNTNSSNTGNNDKNNSSSSSSTSSVNVTISTRSPSYDDPSDPKIRRNSLIVSLKLGTKKKKGLESLKIGKENGTSKFQQQVDNINTGVSGSSNSGTGRKRQASTASDLGNGAETTKEVGKERVTKRMRVSRDYSDSESEEEPTVIAKKGTARKSNIGSSKDLRDERSNSPSSTSSEVSAMLNTPKVGSSKLNTPKLGSSSPSHNNNAQSTKNNGYGDSETRPNSASSRMQSPVISQHNQSTQPNRSASSASLLSGYTPEQRKSSSQVLIAKSSHWRNLAHEQKRKAENLRKTGSSSGNSSNIKNSNSNNNNASSNMVACKKSIAYGMDSVLGYLIAFEYHDRADQLVRRSRQTGNWNSLVKYIDWLIALIQSVADQSLSNSNSNNDKKTDEDLFKSLIGLCCQLRAMVYMRVSQCYHELMLRVMNSSTSTGQLSGGSPDSSSGNNGSGSVHGSTRDSRDARDLRDQRDRDSLSETDDSAHRLRDLATITSKYFKSQTEVITEFKKGFKDLPVENVRLKFPKTWAAREVPDNSTGAGGKKSNSRGFRPMEDSYMLPLHVYSTLQEATAFACRILREWCARHNVEYESILADR